MNENGEYFNSGFSKQDAYHVSVLLNEAIDSLRIIPNGTYVDCTFGGGGHSMAILSRLGKNGKLIAFDQDEDAKRNLLDDERVIFVPHNFRHLHRFLRFHHIESVDGILADLGVSSHQFNEAARGFSTRFDAKLDMRMDRKQSITAFDILQTYSEEKLHKLFEQYGEVTNSKTLAKTIVQLRNNILLNTTTSLQESLRGIVKGNPKKYFAQVFQALRIEVNDEFESLKELLQQSISALSLQGRIVIITFHSLEDRVVKNFFRRGSFSEPDQNPFISTRAINKLKVITKKPIVPSNEEVKQNARSASAKLRVAEKIEL